MSVSASLKMCLYPVVVEQKKRALFVLPYVSLVMEKVGSLEEVWGVSQHINIEGFYSSSGG